MRTLALACVVIASAAGCQAGSPGAPKASAAPVASASAAPARVAARYGAPLGASPLVPLASIARDTARYAGQVVRTEGTVTAVCQQAGCWMEIGDQATDAHVRFGGHKFLVPKSSSGKHAVVQGLVLAQPDEGECEGEAKAATGKPVRLEIDATGVELM